MPSQIVKDIRDLSSVSLTVRVRYGWRATVATWLLHLAKWVGGSQLEFIGDKDTE